MAIKVYDPKITVTLYKIVRRDDLAPGLPVAGKRGDIVQLDLTSSLGDGGAVRTTKGVCATRMGGNALRRCVCQ